MRDYYDLTVLSIVKSESINVSDLREALEATSRKRESHELMADWEHILKQIREDVGLMGQWERYQRKYDYAADYGWEDIVGNIEKLFGRMMIC